MENKKQQINNYFISLREHNSQINNFFSYLDGNNVHYAILGGSIRAALCNSSSIRDVDVIFQSDDSLIYDYLLTNDISFKMNSFDGLKFNLGNIQFDAWNIANHYAFKNSFYETQFDNIYKTTFINYDSLMYDFTTNILYDTEYQSCINDNQIRLIGSKKLREKNPNKELSICKILEVKKNQHLNLSEDTKKFIKDFCESCKYKKRCMTLLQEAYKIHYKKDMSKSLSSYIKKQLEVIYEE